MTGTNLKILIECDGSLFIPGDPSADTTCACTTSAHAEVGELEGDDVVHLVGSQIQLDAVVHLWKRKVGFVCEADNLHLLYLE